MRSNHLSARPRAAGKQNTEKALSKKKTKKSEPVATKQEVQQIEFRSREERIATGKLLREKVPRSSHAD